MKRLFLRLSALIGVVAVGLIAIAQAQRGIDSAEPQSARSAETAAPLGEEALQPIPTQGQSADTDAGGPDASATGPAATNPFDNAGKQGAKLRSPATETATVRHEDGDIPSAENLFPEDDSITVTRAQYEQYEPSTQGERFAQKERSVAPADFEDQDASGARREITPPARIGHDSDPDPQVLSRAAVDVQPVRKRSGADDGGEQDGLQQSGNRFGRQASSNDAYTTASSAEAFGAPRENDRTNRGAASLQGSDAPSDAGRSFQPGSISEPASSVSGSADEGTSTTSGWNNNTPLNNSARPPAEDRLTADQGTGRPGDARLEGMQSPIVTLEKIAPEEIQLGKPATFEIRVRNGGQIPAHGVEVRDEVPQGARLEGSTPPANRGARGELVWTLGTLNPGEESTIQLELVPLDEGEIGSTAEVRFSAQATSRTRVTRPILAVDVTAPERVMIGEDMTLRIRVSNTGSGAATGVMIQQQLPDNLTHVAGPDLEYEVGTLEAGESREVSLAVAAAKAGVVRSTLVALADGDLTVEKEVNLEVLAPELQVALTGPKRRYLDLQATYSISVANPGTASAKEVHLVTYLPEGMKFVKADNYGEYDPQNRTVQWLLEELPHGEQGTVQLTAVPTEPGEHTLSIQGTAQQGLVAEEQQAILVEGIAAILFEVVNVADPIEVGNETTYEIRVVNQGTKAAENVRIVAVLPREMKAVAAEGESRYVFDGQRVMFDALPRLAPKADTTYRIRVEGVGAGDARIRVELMTDEMTTPVTKEESTHIFSSE